MSFEKLLIQFIFQKKKGKTTEELNPDPLRFVEEKSVQKYVINTSLVHYTKFQRMSIFQ